MEISEEAKGLSVADLRRLSTGKGLEGTVLTEPSIAFWDGARLVTWNGDVPYYPACMIKIPLCLVAYMLLDAGKIPIDMIEIKLDQVVESVFPSKLAAGCIVSLERLIHDALYYSDNTAANVLIDLVGRERGTSLLREIGLENTAIRRWLVGAIMKPDPYSTGRNSHTARDAAILISMLAEQKVPHSADILKHLKHSSLPELGFFGLHEGDQLYYKDGYTSAVLHAGMLVVGPAGRKFVLVIYTNQPFSPDNYARITSLVRAIRGSIDLGSPGGDA